MTSHRRSHILRTLIAVVALSCSAAIAVSWIVNRPETLTHALAIANLKSPWKISIKSFVWHPLRNTVDIKGIGAINDSLGKEAKADRVFISFKPLGLLRGKLVIDDITIDGMELSLSSSIKPGEKKSHKRLNLARLLLLRNLELKSLHVNGLWVAMSSEKRIKIDKLQMSLMPSIWGDTKLILKLNNTLIAKGENRIAFAGTLGLKAETKLTRWTKELPYLNAIDGGVRLTDITVAGINAESFSSSLGLEDRKISLSDISLFMKGNALSGVANIDLNDQTFDCSIDIPKPILLPFIGKPMETLDTAGEISGKISLAGKGFLLSQSNGSGSTDVSYRFTASPTAPVSVASNFRWGNGNLLFSDAKVHAGQDSASAEGLIDLSHKHFSIRAKGKDFPLEHVFEKFRNPHLKKVFGPTDFDGSIEGWGKKFTARVLGITKGGGWKPILAEHINSELEVTYDYLKLKGTILSNGKITGRSDLSIHYGPKMGTAPRSKQINLDADITDHPLESSLASLKLSGRGNGRIRLSGPPDSFKSEAEATIDNGKWHILPINRASSHLTISKHQIIFSGLALSIPSIAPWQFSGTLLGNIGKDGSFRIHGAPVANLSVDATYRGLDGRWLIREMSWSDPEHIGNQITLNGFIPRVGGMDIKLVGRLDLATLAGIAPFAREGMGPIDIDISSRGTSVLPFLKGTLAFHDNTLAFRGARLALEHLDGILRFDGTRIAFDNIKAKIDDGDIIITGSLDHKGTEPTSANISMAAHSMRYRSEDGQLSLELDGNLSLAGAFPQPLLKGDITILDGKYTKDFTLIDSLSGGKPHTKKGATAIIENFDPRLDLRTRSTGDLAIRNNIGDIWLNMNVDIRGTRRRPTVAGAIQATDGKIHYLGMDFDITKGFIEFLEKYQAPYLEVQAQKEVGVYNISAILRGPTDNLILDLSASSPAGPLEKRDVISLLLFGITDQERSAMQQTGGQITTSALAGTVSGVVGRPIQKITGLDVFRLEAASGTTNVSRVYMGKKITDRLSVNFATDINTSNAVQTIIGEYQITDNFLVKGEHATDSSSKITGSLRFKLR